MGEDSYWRGDDPTPKRIRFHLLTLVLATLTSSVLLGANLTPYVADAYRWGTGEHTGTCPGQGWPINFRPTHFGNSFVLNPDPLFVAVDVVFAACLVAFVAVVSEYFARRRIRNVSPTRLE